MRPEVAARLVDAESLSQARIESRAVRSAVAHVAAVESWYVPADVQVLASRVGSTVRAASIASAGVTDAYLARVLSYMLDAPPKTTGVLDLSRPLRRGARSYEQVYERVAETVRYYESTGLSRLEALERATVRADAMVRTDLALARRAQANRVYTRTPQVTHWRRILRPELSQRGPCGLCVAASDRVYSRHDLLPLHDRCKCTTLPILGDMDPGRDIDREMLDLLYEEAGSTYGAALKGVRVQIIDHGELGPMLVDGRHRTARPGSRQRRNPDRQPTSQRDPARMITAELDALTKSLANIEARIAAGVTGLDAPLTYQRNRIATLTARLRAL